MSDKKYRLVTRGDFDGVVTGALLKELGMIESVIFVEPGQMQSGNVPISGNDITTNLPFVETAHLCFDHHISEMTRVSGDMENRIIDPDAPSAARVIYNHYGGKKGFPEISEELLEIVDKSDSAQFSIEEIMAPDPWGLLTYIIDPRTGLDGLSQFAISKEQLMEDLMTYCRHNPIEEIMQLPDIAERVEKYNYFAEFAELQIVRCSKIEKNLIITDLRNEEVVYAVNRFLVYAIHPEINISMNVQWNEEKTYAHIAVGKSIVDRSSNTNVGPLMLEYGGGGHMAAGTCHIKAEDVDRVIAELTERITIDG